MADKGTHELRAFLEGTEGFDSTLVDECLSRLVDAGYDTIGVLKLAKKRDLIEDVGLKPGYALRIVSAAQNAVAPSHSTEHGAMTLECRRRNETLVKSYSAIKKYCDKQNKEFRQLSKEDFRNMKDAEQKPATRLLERWYNQIGDRCPPRSNKKMRNQGAGGSLENGVDIVSSSPTSRPRPRNPISCGLPGVESTKVLAEPHVQVDQSNPVSEGVEIVEVWNELKATAFVTILCLVIVWDSQVAELG